VAASHSRTVPSTLVLVSKRASGLNATPLTASVWPVSGEPCGCPEAASHNRTVPSTLAVASSCPSGLNAAPFTVLVWPVSGEPCGCPVAAFHNRTVASALVVASSRPLGLNATPVDGYFRFATVFVRSTMALRTSCSVPEGTPHVSDHSAKSMV
jgi:hypothetical protein